MNKTEVKYQPSYRQSRASLNLISEIGNTALNLVLAKSLIVSQYCNCSSVPFIVFHYCSSISICVYQVHTIYTALSNAMICRTIPRSSP